MDAATRRITDRRRSERGITFVEVLAAALILAVALMALLNVFLFTFSITHSSDDLGMAYQLARATMEQTRAAGYVYTAPGTSDTDYDKNGDPATSGGAYFRVTGTIVQGGAVGPMLNPREVTIVVTRLSDAAELCRTRTYMAMGGI